MVSASDDQQLEAAQRALERGEVVGVPTDTVYGLGVRASDPLACDRIFALKGRPDSVALPTLVGNVDDACALIHESARAELRALGMAFWPGALSVVVPRAPGVEFALGGDSATIGLRVPKDELARALIGRCGPLAVSSANRHGQPPCTTPAQLEAVFGVGLGALLDGGVCDGLPSTVVSIVGDVVTCLRQGPIDSEQISAILGRPVRRDIDRVNLLIMRVAVGSDHAGFELKALHAAHLESQGHEVIDLGTHSKDPVDYPDYGAAVGRAIAGGAAEVGLCCCGTGIGISIAANKIHGVRAAVVHDESSSRLAREHNDANVVCFGARLIGTVTATDSLDTFLGTKFAGGRHLLRIEKLSAIEQSEEQE